MASSKTESTSSINVDDDIEDPVERMLKKTGCLEKHYSVQECIAETKDWRKCQEVVQDFKECMEAYNKTKRVPPPSS